MGLTNKQRQELYLRRDKGKTPSPPIAPRVPIDPPITPRVSVKSRKDTRSRVQRWQAAVEVLRELQAEYQEWLDNLPESLEDSPVADKLQAVCELDIDELDIDLPKGFGRD